VSEWIHNGTLAQLGHTVPFMSVYAGKYGTEDKSKTERIQKLNTTPSVRVPGSQKLQIMT